MSQLDFSQNQQGVHADIALTNILIPGSNTAYRLTLFLWNPTFDVGAGAITFTVQWTAPFGGVFTAPVVVNLASAPSPQTIDMTIWVLAGTPVQISVLGGGTYGAATYSYLLGLKDLTEGSPPGPCGSSNAIVPIAPQNISYGCNKCQQNPCCCQGNGNAPNIIVVGQQQPYPPFQPRRRIRYEDDGGPWLECCS